MGEGVLNGAKAGNSQVAGGQLGEAALLHSWPLLSPPLAERPPDGGEGEEGKALYCNNNRLQRHA